MQEGIEFVKCQICGLEFGTLCRHLGVHGIDADEYVRRYPGAKVIADKIRDGRSAKLRAKPKKGNRLTCKYCGGKFEGRVQRRAHERREESVYLTGEQGKDFVVCLECGFRESRISPHVSGQHGMTVEEYRAKHPDAPVEVQSLIEKQNASKRAKGGYKPISERRRSQQCKACGDWYVFGGQERHLRECLVAHPDAYLEGRDYIKCPECRDVFLLLGKHMRQVHGWDANRLAVETGRGLKLTAQLLADKRNAKKDFKAIQEKREQTHLERHGHKNPFSDPAVQEKIVETNQRRYGVDHPMQNEDVFARQRESAQNGPSGQETFFKEHVVCPNVVFTGFGSRFIRTKTGVRKYGRVIRDMNPDFMVLPDNVLESAVMALREGRVLDRQKHRTKYVIELLGDYYHSEKVIGVPPAEHEKEVVDAYKSAGIECLALWEHDVLGRWNEIEPMVNAWIQKAVADINAHPVWKKATRHKVDGRLGTLPCPFGSGKVFKSQAKLDKWVASPLNFWRPEMVEGRDYVRCLECLNVRVGKVAEHLRTMHGGMTKEIYLEKHPGALLVASRVSELVARNNRLLVSHCI
jgi:predicted transcriptional regulator/uncharacterized C2H2 Zn-finger protein